MSERDGYQPGVPCWVDTWQPDADAAVTFYTELFGWEAEDTMPPGTPGKHFMCRLRGRDVAAVASRPEAAPPVTAWTTYVWAENAADTVAKAVDSGGSIFVEPFESLDGGRIGIIADPAGAAIGVWQPGAHRGAQLINEPSAWAMSQLSSPDPEGAKEFYGAVFGWEPESFVAGDFEATMWRLPGYVGGEPEQPVPRDVVGVMAPADDGPPVWAVDFWIADAEEAAGKTPGLGGKVIAPPHDAAGFKRAVLADPQGAVFSVSQLKLPG
jgi:predicted enzyme related to lactoylglutathione lyase